MLRRKLFFCVFPYIFFPLYELQKSVTWKLYKKFTAWFTMNSKISSQKVFILYIVHTKNV